MTPRNIAFVVVWLSLAVEASAHPLHIEKWKHAANMGFAIAVSLILVFSLRKRIGVLGRTVGGLVVFLLLIIAGYILTFVSSL